MKPSIIKTRIYFIEEVLKQLAEAPVDDLFIRMCQETIYEILAGYNDHLPRFHAKRMEIENEQNQ